MAEQQRRSDRESTAVPVDGAVQPRENARGRSGEDIARRAYERYCERGCEDGHDLEDWLAAEREVSGRGEKG